MNKSSDSGNVVNEGRACGRGAKRRWGAVAVTITAVLLSVVHALAASAAVSTPLKDQFGAKHKLSEKLGRGALVVVAGDQRKSRDALRAWATPLATSLPKGATLVVLAELDSVPFFIPNSTVTDKLIEIFPKVPVLCDWDNEVYEAIGFKDDTLSSVAVYDKSGTRQLHLQGLWTPERQKKVQEAVAKLSVNEKKSAK